MSKHSTIPRTLSRRLAALLAALALLAAMALPVYAEADLLPDAHDEVELLEDEPGTASGEDTALPEQNAATPEPEQSAEPEQPAPTETPEPTAEPTLTPEPAATATATPVPTVTPTATPEPTEQPQKMYAAKRVDNVQAASASADTYTLYFAVPDGWSDCTVVKIYAADGGNPSSDHKYFLDMQEVDETKERRKIYSVVLNHDDHYHNGGLNGLEFRGYKSKGEAFENGNPADTAYKVVIAEVDRNLGSKWMSFNSGDTNNYIGGNYYDGNKGGGWNRDDWTTYTVGHKHFAGQKMAFENKTSKPLTNVQAWFYEPDGDENLILVSNSIPLNIAPNSTATFNIPDDFCSYVKFTWNEGNSPKSSKIYNFYGKDVSGNDEESFTYSDISNCFIYTGADNTGAVNGRWGIENSFCIYYDATFSKLPTTGKNDTGGDYSIPKAGQSTVYYRIRKQGETGKNGTMSRIKGTDYYVADVPDGYTEIVFSSYPLSDDNKLATCGDSTNWVTIPENYKNTEQCFYADTNDDAVYHKGTRGGYWAPKGTKRDAEEWKKTGTKVVDIKPAEFTEEANTKYVTSTLYDYYTDYELNGNNRGNYGSYTDASHRNWVPFREFDQALSDYYEEAGAEYPIYTGHFQPAGSPEFREIASTLNLFGYSNDDNVKFNRFMAINNSQRNEDNSSGSDHTYYAYQGLVADKTSTGNADGAPLLNGTTSAVEPHFNKEFLLGENSKNAKLGEVYENVKFPFTKVPNLFGNETDVDYWCFDSKDTTLYLKQDSDSKYFLQKSTTNREPSKNVSALSNPKDPYGYFPFNETATPGVFSTYNYGFGTKLQMDFTLTDDGMVKTEKADGTTEKTSIKFFFSGDDDVWVFIDGQLALDVGGAHGEVSGLLEFGETTENGKEKNSVTAYVSRVKKGGTLDKDDDKDKDEKNVNSPVKTVKYKGEDIKFYAQGTTLTFDKGQKHTLTMYYMERGMWESNMAVAFNFPDNNELQVQKKVDLKNVTDQKFKECFEKQKIFNFTIQNQATHYGTTPAVGPNESENPSQHVNLTAEGNKIEPATKQTESNKGDYIFELATNPKPDPGNKNEQVLHWYARYPDTEPVSYWRKQRYGILTLNNPINIKDMRFLTFQVYTDSNDGGELSLNNLYLELLDNQQQQDPTKSPGQKGSLGTTGINGATYGSVEVKTDKWVTVKLDLHKMKEQDGFSGNVKTIRVGDNYSRNIYFRNFTFIPKAVPSTMTGFTTDQEKIPDYGSAKSGQLEKAKYAQYTSTEDTDTQLVDEDGRFVLEDGEIVTFSDQFRRGSYISLKEDLNPNLYDTTWTVYENGQAVTSMKDDSESVTVADKNKSLDKQEGSSPNDGRTEKIRPNDEQAGNSYTGNKPSADTIVFRSYKDPDETSSTLTKLKVEYVNTVKTGGLKIQKKAAAGEEGTIKGTYTFKVTFNDVGGEGLEEKPIEKTVTIDMSDTSNHDHTVTITGIPVGTRYTIEEVGSTDGAKLQSVTVPPNCNSAHVIKNNTMVEGEIKEADTYPITAIFTNTQRTLINIEFDKLWKDANGNGIGTMDQPDEIYIQLQRRLANSIDDKDWKPVNYPADSTKNYVTIERGESGWRRTFSGLDQYQINTDTSDSHTDYVYRIVEGTVKDGSFTAVKPNETITIKGNTYVVTAEAKAEISEGDSTKNTQATATDGTITGDSGKIELTNKLQNPKFNLDILKKSADEPETPLKGVEFKLEKLMADGKTVDKDFTARIGITNAQGKVKEKDSNGNATEKDIFHDLEAGAYRLTETKAAAGYNLLSAPILVTFGKDETCTLNGSKIEVSTKGNKPTEFTKNEDGSYTLALTVLNRKTPALPHTGADAPSLWLLIGLPLAVAGLLILVFRYNKKGGRTR